MRTLTQRDLNRALLARQLLLERVRLSLPRALERMGGLQAQYAPSMYIGLWSRVAGFERAQLTRALERRAVVQGTLLRATIHLVSARDYWPFALAVRAARRTQWLKFHRGVDARGMAAAARKLRRAGTLSAGEMTELLGRDRAIGVGLWLDLVRVPPSGTWERRRADLFAPAEDWLGPPDVEPEEGVDLLLRRYLGAFGPATPGDVAQWAGLPKPQIVAALERARLRKLRDESGRVLHDLPRAPLPPSEAPAPVRFLPVWDATLLVHARRTGILPEEYRPAVFNVKTPHSVNTFLVDGRVAGTWREERGRIRIEPFEPLPRTARREVEDEAKRLERLFV